MQIRVQFDTKALKARTAREQKRLAFNTAQALNETAKSIQTAERVNLDRRLTLRKAGFMYRLIKITAFANARAARPFAEIAIDPSKRRILLGRLEKGGVKQPEVGKRVAVPITGQPARPRFGLPVPVELQIGRLRFRRHSTQSGKAQWKGARRTFIIPQVGIFQRGEGKKSARPGRKRFKGLVEKTKISLLYAFEQRPQLKAMLHFIDTAISEFNKQWKVQFAKAYRK